MVIPACAYHDFLDEQLARSKRIDTSESIQMDACEMLFANVLGGRCGAGVPNSLSRAQRDLSGITVSPLMTIDIWLVWKDDYRLPAFEALRAALLEDADGDPAWNRLLLVRRGDARAEELLR